MGENVNFSQFCCHLFQIIRDAAGAPDVLTRLEGPQPNPGDGTADAVISEYES
jgi:hypothetical protein